MKGKTFYNAVPGADGAATIFLYGNVGEGCAVDSAMVATKLAELEKTSKKINVFINSKGGEVFSGMAIYNALRYSKADITIYVTGLAASIAGVIALCGRPLYMSPYSRLMLHQVSGGAFGGVKALKETAEVMESIQNSVAGMIAQRCKMTEKEVADKYFDGTDHWLTAQEAVEMGLADGLFETEVPAKALNTTDEIYNYFNNQLEAQAEGTNHQKSKMDFIDKVKFLFGIDNSVTEDGVITQLQNLNAAQKTIAGLRKDVEDLRKENATLMASADEALVDAAIKDGRIAEAQKPTFLALLKSDRANTTALIAALQPVQAKPSQRAKDFIHEGGQADESLVTMTWDALDKAGKLADLKAQNFAVFCQKYKAQFGVDYVS